MGFGRALHQVGTVLLFAAVGLLIVADVTAPVVENLALFRVNLGDNTLGDSITFGTFGYCVRNYLGDGDRCSSTGIGYRPTDIINEIDGTSFSDATEGATRALTYVFVLHPVATGLAALAALFSLFEGAVGGIIATLVSGIAFVATAIVLICDFVCFSLLRNDVNDNDNSDSSTSYEAAIWCVLIAAIWCLVGTVINFFTCCSGRSKKRGSRGYSKNHWLHGEPAPYVVQSAPAV